MKNMKLRVEAIGNMIEDLFIRFGEEIDYDYLDTIVESYPVISRLINEGKVGNSECRVFELGDVIYELCKECGYEIIAYSIEHVFDSPGLDIFVLSFVIMAKNATIPECWLNIQHERG